MNVMAMARAEWADLADVLDALQPQQWDAGLGQRLAQLLRPAPNSRAGDLGAVDDPAAVRWFADLAVCRRRASSPI